MQFSSLTLQTIENFAASMNLSAVPAPDQSFTFEFSRTGSLSLMSADDGRRVLVSLARLPIRADAEMELRFFQKAGFDPNMRKFIHAGLAPDGNFICVLSFDEAELDLPSLDRAISRLAAVHDECGI